MVSVSWFSSTICSWCRLRSEQLPCTTFCEKSCGNMPRPACTTTRRASGIVVVLSQTGATFSKKRQGPWTRAPEFGRAVRTDLRTRESPSWAPPWGGKNSLNGNLPRSLRDHSELFTHPRSAGLAMRMVAVLLLRSSEGQLPHPHHPP